MTYTFATCTKRSNRDRLFAIFAETYLLRIHDEEIAEYLREHWLCGPRCLERVAVRLEETQ